MPREKQQKSVAVALTGMLVGAAVLLAGCQRNISGTYLASDKSTVALLQVVRTPDNRLTGQIAATVLKPDSTIERNSVSITGAADGENVTIQGSRFFGLESFVLSGTLNGNVLTLTGAESVPLTFTRSTTAEFEAKIAQLNAQSQTAIQTNNSAQAEIRKLNARVNFVTTIGQLTERMERFESNADVHLGRFPGAEKGYEGLTARMAEYVAKERQLAGNPDAGYTRGQLSYAVNQVSGQTEQMHYQGETLQSSLESDVKPVADESARLEEQCQVLALSPGSLNSADLQGVKSACGRLESAVTPFKQKFSAMSDGLAHLEQVYQRERDKQQELIQESEKLE
jgi:hypothetical protein